MGRCDFCGVEEAMPFKCSYCGGTFCATHRLPEQHNCLGQKQTKQKPISSRSYLREKEAKSNPIKAEKKDSSKAGIIIALLLCIIGLVLSWNYSDIQGYTNGFSDGFSEAEPEGLEFGYTTGYQEGFVKGNTTGTIDGYEIGYENAMYLGKETGNNDGYNTGYLLGFKDGNQTGFNSNYIKGLADIENRAYNLRNVTYAEVRDFLRRDRTDRADYRLSSFKCDDFSRTVKNNAFNEGIHCYYVSIDFPEPPGHAIIAFYTVDKGLLFFEPQSDEKMDVEIGLHYWLDNGDYIADYDDTIVNFDLIW